MYLFICSCEQKLEMQDSRFPTSSSLVDNKQFFQKQASSSLEPYPKCESVLSKQTINNVNYAMYLGTPPPPSLPPNPPSP